jgi:hypothetical protein
MNPGQSLAMIIFGRLSVLLLAGSLALILATAIAVQHPVIGIALIAILAILAISWWRTSSGP